jgi:hypothetical protein
MQGILRTHYKLVEQYLNKLQEESVVNPLCTYGESILQHKNKLNEIYENYREAFEQMSMIIKQFEEHKQSVKRLVVLQKKKKKEMTKISGKTSTISIRKRERLLMNTD